MMNGPVTRRRFLGAAAAAPVAAAGGAERARRRLRILGVSCSPRPGKTTAAAVRIALEAARAAAPDRVTTELVELAGLHIPGQLAAGQPLAEGERDDFPAVAARLAQPDVAGLIVGTPVYFANMSSLCKAFLERCGTFRKQGFALADKVAGALAVGGVRNGGQELAVRSIQAVFHCHEMLVVGDGRPTGHFGATLWNPGTDDISGDEFGVQTARNLGRRVAEAALRRWATA